MSFDSNKWLVTPATDSIGWTTKIVQSVPIAVSLPMLCPLSPLNAHRKSQQCGMGWVQVQRFMSWIDSFVLLLVYVFGVFIQSDFTGRVG